MSEAIASRRASSLQRVLPVLAIGSLLLLGGIFRTEVISAIGVWDASTAYNHCFLILPIAAWLAWHRRSRLAGLSPRPTLVALPLALAVGIVWFIADRLGIMEGRQLAVIAFIEILFLSVLGWPLYRALLVPLLYLFFLVPFGGFLVPLLQTFSTHFVVHGLDLLGIPNYSEGNVIEIPQGSFYIAEACAGLRFLIAAIAFGVLYACVIYKGAIRRLLFMIASVVVPVVANGFRCLGIVWLGNVLGSARAAATDHILYGYLFFSIVLLLLIILGLLFREDTLPAVEKARPRPGNAPRGSASGSIFAGGGTIVVALIFPLLVAGINRAAAATRPAVPTTFPGCVADGTESIPTSLASRAVSLGRFSCRSGDVTLDLAAFSPRIDPKSVIDVKRWLSGGDTREAEFHTLVVPDAVPERWDLVVIKDPPGASVSTLWIDGVPAPSDLRTRARQAFNGLVGSTFVPLVVSVKADGSPETALARLRAFLRTDGVPAESLARIAARH